jgi:solute carrier family 8 (sodium/calcium exchanger)
MVPAGGLGFSVMIFSLVAILAIILLVLRRKMELFGKAELGGPFWPKMFSVVFLIGLWLIYIILSSLQAYKVFEINF